jgi:hypothetical protein
MGKTMKIALATLYALQVIVIFRESVMYLTSGSGEEPGEQKQNSSESPEFNDPRAFLKRTFQPWFKRNGSLVAGPVAAVAAVLTEIKKEEDPVHPPEHRKDFLPRRTRVRRFCRYLMANLAPGIQKVRPPAGADAATSPIVIRRAQMFVGAS